MIQKHYRALLAVVIMGGPAALGAIRISQERPDLPGLFGPPLGSYLHTGGPTDGGRRILEVWESEEAAGAFYGSEQFQQVMKHVGMPAPKITSYPIEAVKK